VHVIIIEVQEKSTGLSKVLTCVKFQLDP
jgi:hypothetical protein